MNRLLESLTDIGRVVRAFGYSLAGLRAAYIRESAFRQELALFLVLAPLGLWLGHGYIERVLLVGSLVLVLIVELLNSAVEAAVDRLGAESHELSGRAKDMGSAAVLLAMLLVLFTWGAILLPRL
jgi:diacylglycerol kinase (ATP)